MRVEIHDGKCTTIIRTITFVRLNKINLTLKE